MRWLVIAEWRRMVVGLVRYPIDTIASTLTLFLVFAGLFYGARYITSSPIGGGRLSTVVLGYTVWIVMMAATGDMAWSVQNEAQNGTLEQVMMVPWNAVWVFFVRAVMAIVGMLVPVGAVLVALLAMTHVHLAWRSAALVPMAMVIGTAWGLGLLVAGVALLLKRVGQVLQIVQFLLLFVITLGRWKPRLSSLGRKAPFPPFGLHEKWLPCEYEAALVFSLLPDLGAGTGARPHLRELPVCL